MPLTPRDIPARLDVVAMLAAIALLAIGCGPKALETGPTVPTVVRVGAAERTITTITDLDEIRDVATGADEVYVATDRGLLVHPADAGRRPARLTREAGLPSDDVTAVAVARDGTLWVATAEGMARVQGETATPTTEQPPIGKIRDLVVGHGGRLWACGDEGLAQLREEGWVRIGEAARCTTLAPSSGEGLYVGTASGLWLVAGEVIREHAPGQGLPDSFVRSIAPMEDGRVMALLAGPGQSRIGYFDGERWYGYSVPGLELPAVGLAPNEAGDGAILFTAGHAIEISAGTLSEGVSLKALSASEERGVRSYGARVVASDEVERVQRTSSSSAASDVPVSALVAVTDGMPTIDAPDFVAMVAPQNGPDQPYCVRYEGGKIFVADRNRGVTAWSASGVRHYRSLDLVDEMDLRMTYDAVGRTWFLTAEGDLGVFENDRLERVPPPEGTRLRAIASGPDGLYAVGMPLPPPVPADTTAATAAGETATPAAAPAAGTAAAPAGARVRGPGRSAAPTVVAASTAAAPEGGAAAPSAAPNRVTIYRMGERGWLTVVERELNLPTALVDVPYLAVAADRKAWIGIKVARDDGVGARLRGIAVIDPSPDAPIVYHHRGADPATDGEGALQMPDEIAGIDLNMETYAWAPTLNGAVRIGNHQAVVYDETRGVRGEVVSDVAVADNGVVWIASAEGIGFYEDGEVDFRIPQNVQRSHTVTLAVDSRGGLWGAGPNGALHYDGRTWSTLGESDGLPAPSLYDVEVDGEDRIWFLAADRVFYFAAPTAASSPELGWQARGAQRSPGGSGAASPAPSPAPAHGADGAGAAGSSAGNPATGTE